MRADLGDSQFPVILVQLGCVTIDSPIVDAWNAIRLGQHQLPENVANTAMTSAVDLPVNDCIHISAAGLKRLGARLAVATHKLMSGTPGTEIGPRLKNALQILEPPDRTRIELAFSGVSGGWLPADHIAGFDVLDAGGKPHGINHVINAFRHAADPASIVVLLNLPLGPGEALSYGHGLRPYCNAVDQADFPLCSCVISYDSIRRAI